MGVTRLKPCPMAQESVSPSNQGTRSASASNALSGTIPDFSSESSIPVGWLRPNFREYSAILSIPSFNPTWIKVGIAGLDYGPVKADAPVTVTFPAPVIPVSEPVGAVALECRILGYHAPLPGLQLRLSSCMWSLAGTDPVLPCSEGV